MIAELPTEVAPIIDGDTRYEAPHTLGHSGGRHVIAWDLKNDQPRWCQRIYGQVESNLAGDLTPFINRLRLADGCLLVDNDRWERFQLDLATLNVRRLPDLSDEVRRQEDLQSWDRAAALVRRHQPRGISLARQVAIYSRAGAWNEVWGVAETLHQLALDGETGWRNVIDQARRQGASHADPSHLASARELLHANPHLRPYLKAIYDGLREGRVSERSLTTLRPVLEDLQRWQWDNVFLREACQAARQHILGPIDRPLEWSPVPESQLAARLRAWVVLVAMLYKPV